MSAPILLSLSGLRRISEDKPWSPAPAPIVVGKDILELLSTSMYVNPMSIYREYIQNAADAIDEARETGLIPEGGQGRVDLFIDIPTRTVKIRDDGVGLGETHFVQRLTSFGASVKRGRGSRGFRGVGRLAGIGYCQELIFRARNQDDCGVNELRWDCKELKNLLRAPDPNRDLNDVVKETVFVRRIDAERFPEHFFEVELRGIVRHRNDQLLDSVAVNSYLSQVAPVPFSREFRHGEQITDALSSFVKLGNIQIRISGLDSPVYRPHRNRIELSAGEATEFNDLQFFTVPAVDGGTGAIGWVLHHAYAGALPPRTNLKGLRLRVGNIQVGDDRLMEELFTEPRFNGWVVGEIHVVDSRLVPNGRRDHFEQNVHYHNLLTHVAPIARELSRTCRLSSLKRNRSRDFVRQVEATRDKLSIVRQGALGRGERARLLREVHALIADLEKLAKSDLFEPQQGIDPARQIQKLKRQVATVESHQNIRSALDHLPRTYRRAYEKVFSLIYECAPNRTVAKALVDRIMARLS